MPHTKTWYEILDGIFLSGGYLVELGAPQDSAIGKDSPTNLKQIVSRKNQSLDYCTVQRNDIQINCFIRHRLHPVKRGYGPLHSMKNDIFANLATGSSAWVEFHVLVFSSTRPSRPSIWGCRSEQPKRAIIQVSTGNE